MSSDSDVLVPKDNKVIIVQSGYSTDDKADCSVTLVKSPEIGWILVDTSSPCFKAKLVDALKQQDVSPPDINIVVGTHGHVDHIGNLNLFPNAKFIVGFDICKSNVYEDFDFNTHSEYFLTDTIYVLATPGHTCQDVSLVVKNSNQGTVVVGGDLFECEEDLVNSELWTSKSFDRELQEKNREKVLDFADFIIPGHGPGFKNPKI